MFGNSDCSIKFAGVFLILAFIVGCSSLGQIEPREVKPLNPRELPPGSGWWHASFRLHWPPDTKPPWHMDLFLAHQVILPRLKQYENQIYLWRFHRRAARDNAGRMFSFIFFASASTAENVLNGIKIDPSIDRFIRAGIIDRAGYDDPMRIIRPNLEDEADKSWPLAVRRAWPYYMMGASQLWLNLIAETAAQKLADQPPASVAEIESFYQQVDRAVTEVWQNQGQHAFMHHLNALFEYEPLIYRERRYMTF